VRRSETLLHGVVREDPSRIDAYFALGIIYRESSLRTRALAMFRKVLDLSPKHGPALAQVRALEKPAPSGNLLGRV
jgi:cytochrome c-type biogenesis protein CcmH/NrfG